MLFIIIIKIVSLSVGVANFCSEVKLLSAIKLFISQKWLVVLVVAESVCGG